MEGDFAFDLLGKLFAVRVVSFVEPTVEIVGFLDWVVAGNVGGKDVMSIVPRIGAVCVGRDRESIGAESWLDDAGDNSLRVETTLRPFELAFGVGTIVLALIPIGDWDGDRFWVAEGGNVPDGRNAVFVSDVF